MANSTVGGYVAIGDPRKYCSEAHKVEAQIKDQTWERMRQRLGDEYLAEHANFLEAQWEWAKQLGMVGEEVDLIAER